MKRFLLVTTLYFILPLAVLGTTYELLLRNIPNDYSYKKEYMNNNSEEIEVLVLGNSHSYRGITPEKFELNTFNLSYVSQSLNYDYELFLKFKDDLKSLKAIILSISYPSLFTVLGESKESWRVKNYEIYYKINTSNSFRYKSEIFSSDFSINSKRFMDFYFRKKSPMLCSKYCWGGGKTIKGDKIEVLKRTGEEAAKRHTKDIYDPKIQKIFEANISAVDAIIETAAKQDVLVFLILPPGFQSYNNHLDNRQLRLTIEAAEFYAKKYKNCQYLNFLKDDRFGIEDFRDADHLNDKGAEKLSNILNDVILHKIQ